MLRVLKVEGEPTRYMVESNHLVCVNPQCSHLVSKRLASRPVAGGPCPRCGAVLDERWHLVDISAHSLNGQCSCEYFGFVMGPKLRGMGVAEQGEGKCRCSHIEVARDFCLDVCLKLNERVRMVGAGRQTEEAAP